MSTQLDTELKETARGPLPAHDDFLVRPRSRRVPRAVAWAVAVALIVGAVALMYSRRGSGVPVVHYETATADRGTIAAKSALGSCAPS